VRGWSVRGGRCVEVVSLEGPFQVVEGASGCGCHRGAEPEMAELLLSFFLLNRATKRDWATRPAHVILILILSPRALLVRSPLLPLHRLPLTASIPYRRLTRPLPSSSPPVPTIPLCLHRELGPTSRPGEQLHRSHLDRAVRSHFYLPWLPQRPSLAYHRPPRALLHPWPPL
jgi:hypothetical protein